MPPTPESQPSGHEEACRELNRSPRLECNLIMKGGVTSGVVYPPAILELSQKFRFRALGGASAGAIAAGMAAAAEYGRQSAPERPGAGFTGFQALEQELRAGDFILKRFKTSPGTAPLLDVFLTYRRVKAEHARHKADRANRPLRLLRWCLTRASECLREVFPQPYSQGTRAGLALAGIPALGLLRWGFQNLALPGSAHAVSGVLLSTGALGLGVLGGVVGGLAGGTRQLWRLFQQLNDKASGMYGICKGSDGRRAVLSDEDNLALTDWLHVRINELAGLPPEGPPLTLRELAERNIEFKLVSTNLSLGQPLVLPLTRGSRSFFFRKEDMEQLFPPPVVDYLERWGQEHVTQKLRFRKGEEQAFLRFPMGDDLPVVAAVRLSLSFPVLLTAVRLFSFTPQAYERTVKDPEYTVELSSEVEEHWFSDGGIASNFPIHVFDAWVPVRPTFGITLYDSPLKDVLAHREVNPNESVQLPRPSDFDMARPPRTRIETLSELLLAVFDTAQSYRDTAQAGLPSYRERIVQVFLQKNEGGLNLDMPEKTILNIQEKGRCAGRRLIERYLRSTPEGECFSESMQEHRWVRMLVLMAQLERELTQVRALIPDEDWKGRLAALYQDILHAQLEAREAQRPWYRGRDEVWCDKAQRRLRALLELVEDWGSEAPFFSGQPPRPEAVLRVTPHL